MAQYVLKRRDGQGGGAFAGPSGRQYEIDAQAVMVVEGELDRDAALAVGKPPNCNEQLVGQPGLWEEVVAEPQAAPEPTPEAEAQPAPALAAQRDEQAMREFGPMPAAAEEISIAAEEPETEAEEEIEPETAEAEGATEWVDVEHPPDTGTVLDPIDPDLGYRRCRGTTRKGGRCKVRARAGSNYCHLHDPEA